MKHDDETFFLFVLKGVRLLKSEKDGDFGVEILRNVTGKRFKMVLLSCLLFLDLVYCLLIRLNLSKIFLSSLELSYCVIRIILPVLPFEADYARKTAREFVN